MRKQVVYTQPANMGFTRERVITKNTNHCAKQKYKPKLLESHHVCVSIVNSEKSYNERLACKEEKL